MKEKVCGIKYNFKKHIIVVHQNSKMKRREKLVKKQKRSERKRKKLKRTKMMMRTLTKMMKMLLIMRYGSVVCKKIITML